MPPCSGAPAVLVSVAARSDVRSPGRRVVVGLQRDDGLMVGDGEAHDGRSQGSGLVAARVERRDDVARGERGALAGREVEPPGHGPCAALLGPVGGAAHRAVLQRRSGGDDVGPRQLRRLVRRGARVGLQEPDRVDEPAVVRPALRDVAGVGVAVAVLGPRMRAEVQVPAAVDARDHLAGHHALARFDAQPVDVPVQRVELRPRRGRVRDDDAAAGSAAHAVPAGVGARDEHDAVTDGVHGAAVGAGHVLGDVDVGAARFEPAGPALEVLGADRPVPAPAPRRRSAERGAARGGRRLRVRGLGQHRRGGG